MSAFGLGTVLSPLIKQKGVFKSWSLKEQFFCIWLPFSLRKQPTFGDATTDFPAKWGLWNERRNSILTTRHYLDLGGASDWFNQINFPRGTTNLRSFLRRHLAGKPVVASTNVGC